MKERTCQWKWEKADKEKKLPSSMSFIHVVTNVAQIKDSFSTSNNPIKKKPSFVWTDALDSVNSGYSQLDNQECSWELQKCFPNKGCGMP